MQTVRIAAVSVNQTPLAWSKNKHNIVDALDKAQAEGAKVICFPELCISGYGCEDTFFSEALHKQSLGILLEIAPLTKGVFVNVGLPLFYESSLYNAAAVLADGKLVGFACKQFLANEGIHYERRWFRPWTTGRKATVSIEGVDIPIGDLFFDCSGIRLGFEICEDAWAADRPGRNHSRRGVDIILNPSASHFAFGKFQTRKRFVIEGSRAFGAAYVYANLSGNESGRAIYDGGSLIAAGDKLISEGPRFSFREWNVTTSDVDISLCRLSRSRSPNEYEDRDRANEARVIIPLALSEDRPPCSAANQTAQWEKGPHIKEEEFARAVCLGLFDYARKSRSKGFVVSLSGGADSAAISCLVALMVRFALLERTLPDFAKCFGIEDAADCSGRDLVRRLLTCVYQASANSSETTRSAAEGIAAAIGARFLQIPVGDLVAKYTNLIETSLGRKLSWEEDDLALQNIQARVRGPSVWMLANLTCSLLLATSNRSEAAVGYATMDGDTCGGLSPITGIDKAFLRRWLVWLEKSGPDDRCKIPALCAVNVQSPTAELRPPGSLQTDEKDLMPYEVLDVIERFAIRDKKSPQEVLDLCRVTFEGRFSDPDMITWVRRFFTLWSRNQWKRERYAPSFHLDDESLDPKTWCRFPILSGEYDDELAQLR